MIDKEKFKLVLALSGHVLIEEQSTLDETQAYCGIMYSYDQSDNAEFYNRTVVGELYSFSPTKELAFEEVYKKWTLKKNSLDTN
jgi:hypothetical protein